MIRFWKLIIFANLKCFESDYGMIQKMIFILFSLLFQLNNNPLIPSKMSSSFLFNIFIHWITYPLIVLHTHILFYLYLCIKIQYFTYSLQIQWFPKNINSLLNLPDYSNSQFTNPFYHLNIYWIPIPTSSFVDILSNSLLLGFFLIFQNPCLNSTFLPNKHFIHQVWVIWDSRERVFQNCLNN